ncbi:biliverdin-producing heme oxygenase [Crenothrix sp.]|uniref:biliverdin-producing heme oxygenase n=1 Tax=Crenothrix sp. TaxID=3100433 RepID=UPI00374DDE54
MKPNYSTPTNGSATEEPPLIMSMLKTETTVAHKQLERTKCFSKLFEPVYSLEDYQALLCYFYGFFSAIEPLIFDDLTEAHRSILGHKVKTDLLIKDLNLLGIDETELKQLPVCDKLPELNSFAKRMGALYVLEGSVLGGRIISKRLKEHLGEGIYDKLNFYSCYGENVGTEWKGFQHFMASQFDEDSTETSEVVAAANDTFLSLHQWLER